MLEVFIADLNSNGRNILVRLHRDRNSLTQAARLPNEIIGRIMSYGKLCDVICWSSICHRWRRAALNQPELWSQIDLKGREFDLEMLLLQTARSRDRPLEISFGERGHQYASLLPKQTLSSLLARARTIIGITSPIWIKAGISESFEMPYLEIMEANLGYDTEENSANCIQNSIRLLHLSISLSWQRLFLSLVSCSYLRTLYICYASDPPSTVLSTVSKLAHLKELYLISMFSFTDEDGPDCQNAMAVNAYPKLDFLCIKDCNTLFVSQIVLSPLISPSTNVYIEMGTVENNTLPFNLHREGMLSTLWIDAFRRNSLLFSHQSSLTEIALRVDDHVTPISLAPFFMNCHNVTSLELNGHLATPNELGLFPNLSQLTILFLVSPADVEKRSLVTTLNASLPRLCSQLKVISLILRRNGATSAAYIDGAGPVIEDFLNYWVDFHGKWFGTIRVQDDINPSRWHRRLIPLFKTMLFCFELGNIAELESSNRPKFPVTRHVYRTKLKLSDLRL
jgi:hypothetical protein